MSEDTDCKEEEDEPIEQAAALEWSLSVLLPGLVLLYQLCLPVGPFCCGIVEMGQKSSSMVLTCYFSHDESSFRETTIKTC